MSIRCILAALIVGTLLAGTGRAEEPISEKDLEAKLKAAREELDKPTGAFILGVQQSLARQSMVADLAEEQKKIAELEKKLAAKKNEKPEETARLRAELDKARADVDWYKLCLDSHKRVVARYYESVNKRRKECQTKVAALEAQLAALREARQSFLDRDLVLLLNKKEIGPIKYKGATNLADTRCLRFETSDGKAVTVPLDQIVALRSAKAIRVFAANKNVAPRKETVEKITAALTRSGAGKVKFVGTIDVENEAWLGYRMPDGKALLVNPAQTASLQAAGKKIVPPAGN